jgi:hypothetical protein
MEATTSRLPKPNNVVVVPTPKMSEFFRQWCIFLRPFVELTDRELDVMSGFLEQRWEMSQSVSDPAVLDALMMSREVKKKVIERCNITVKHFYVVISNLRKKHIIKGNTINPRLIPNIRKDDNGVFQLLILFKDNKLS